MSDHNQPVLVFGLTGHVGKELLARPSPAGFRMIGVRHAEADVTKPEVINQVVNIYKPVVIINLAGYTAVDRAEAEPDIALSVNGHAPGHLASAAAAVGATIIQLSSDYIFDGHKRTPYLEVDHPNPLSVYGRTKLIGEESIRKANPHHVILRTGWLYSDHGHNFLTTMLRLASTRSEVRVVSDQIGAPTAAPDLVDAIYELLPQIVSSSANFGIFHFTNSGKASWYDFAEFIFNEVSRRGRRVPVVLPMETSHYPTGALRPAMSVLDCTKIGSTYGIKRCLWTEAAASVIEDIFNRRQGEFAFEPASKKAQGRKEADSIQQPIRRSMNKRALGKDSAKRNKSKPRTNIGTEILHNSEQLVIASAALLLSIDRRLIVLGNELPNSDDRKRSLREDIEHYELLRKQVSTFHEVVLRFINGGISESVTVQSTKTLAEGIESWWTARHREICQRAYEMSLFLSAVGICTAAGASGTISVVVSGTLLGGRPIVEAVRAIGKSLASGRDAGD